MNDARWMTSFPDLDQSNALHLDHKNRLIGNENTVNETLKRGTDSLVVQKKLCSGLSEPKKLSLFISMFASAPPLLLNELANIKHPAFLLDGSVVLFTLCFSGFWRLLMMLSIVYELALVFLFFQVKYTEWSL
jgi:hypothetical protein